jgi:uncharacterized protein YdhG (YjbR/CyaY superfamily)
MATIKKTVNGKANNPKRTTPKGTKFSTVNEYIASLPPQMRKLMNELRKIIKAEVPEGEDKISYNIPVFTFHGSLIYFAAWKEHISLYPRTAAMEAAIKELSTYASAKGTIRIPADKPLPVDMIKKIVRYRVKENLQKSKQ